MELRCSMGERAENALDSARWLHSCSGRSQGESGRLGQDRQDGRALGTCPGEWVQDLGRFKNKSLGETQWLFLGIWKV